MHECIKEKCRLWQRANHKGCTLIKVLEKECLETGEFRHRKIIDFGIAWEDIRPFTVLDLAGLEKKCKKTGEFQHRKPKEHAVEWEDMGQFSILDLARIGVNDETIRDFMRGRPLTTITTLHSATDHIDELTYLGILGCLESNGFVKRAAQRVKPGDVFEAHDGWRFMAVSRHAVPCRVVLMNGDVPMVGEDGVIQLIDPEKLTAIHINSE